MTFPLPVVVMGVSGSGKSTVGALLAAELEVPFVDADDLHPAANVAKMASGEPLTDDDRGPWLDRVAVELARGPRVVACSALKRAYRDRLRRAAPSLVCVVLLGDRAELAARMSARQDHFMPTALLDSQLAIFEPLESDERAVTLDISRPPSELSSRARQFLESL